MTLTLVLHAKHNDVFHCLHEGKFFVSLRWARVGASEASVLAKSGNPNSFQIHQKTYLHTTSVFDSGVTGELLGRIPTIRTK